MAAWSHEVGADFFTRKILGERVLLYRTTDGEVAAIADRCPHRFAPLHSGRRIGDLIECGYHGLRFNALGQCVLNRYGKQAISQTLNVRRFPLVQRHGALWIWPGDPDLADDATIPDFGYLTENDRRTLFGSTLVSANYELINDNIMDASHSQYVHMDLLGNIPLDLSNCNVTFEEGKGVDSVSVFPSIEVPAAYKSFFDDGDQRLDRTLSFHWLPASMIRNRTFLVPVSRPAHEGIERIGTHFLTPETETSTHYLFAHTRNFRLDDASLDEATQEWQRLGLDGQDRPMIESVQENIGLADFESLHPALLSIDTAPVRVRRILGKLIEREGSAGRSSARISSAAGV